MHPNSHFSHDDTSHPLHLNPHSSPLTNTSALHPVPQPPVPQPPVPQPPISSASSLIPPASHPRTHPAHQTILNNIPLSYSYPLQYINSPVHPPPPPTSPTPPRSSATHIPFSQQLSSSSPAFHSLPTFSHPLTHPPSTSTLPNSQPAAPSLSAPMHHHPTDNHNSLSNTIAQTSSALNSAVSAAAAAAAAVDGMRLHQHPFHTSSQLMQPHSPITSNPLIHSNSSLAPPPPAQHPLTNPFHNPNHAQVQPTSSPMRSEPTLDPSPGPMATTSTAGGTSTVGAASIDAGGAISGSSTANPTEEQPSHHPVEPHMQLEDTTMTAPPSSARSRSPPDSTSLELTSTNKRPHRSISHAEKRRLCEISDDNPAAKHGHIASVFQAETGRRVERSTVTRVLQRKDFWKSAGTRDSNRKRLTSPRFPTIEEALFELIRHRTRVPGLRAKLTDKELMRYSKDIAEIMRKDNGSMDKKSPNYIPHLRSFRGSLSWVTSFKKRNALMPAEESKPISARPFVSTIFPGLVFDIWSTNFDATMAIKTLQEYTRLEDIYFLDVVVFSGSARPECAATSPRLYSTSYDQCAALDEALGITGIQSNDRGATERESNAPSLPPIGLSTPILSLNTTPPEHPDASNPQPHTHSGGAAQTTDMFAGMTDIGLAHQAGASVMEPRHPVDESTIVSALFSANGTGNDKREPWLVGKKPVADKGNGNGEVWADCPIRYFHNRQGWITGRLIRKWFEEFDESLDRNVVVLTSLLSECDLKLLDLKNVTVLPIPSTELASEKQAAMSWSSSSPSPIHHGVEQIFRARYRALVLERVLILMEQRRPLKEPTVRSVACTVKEAWDKVPIPVIRRAWKELPYLPRSLYRSYNRLKSNSKPMWSQTMLELGRLLVTYRDAICSYPYAEEIQLRQSDLFGAMTEIGDYLWVPGEEGAFHPNGTVVEFVRSVCSEAVVKDEGSEEEREVAEHESTGFQIENTEDALQAINKLANFIKSDSSLDNEQNLYLAGSLQLEIRKENDQRRNEAEARRWIAANQPSRRRRL